MAPLHYAVLGAGGQMWNPLQNSIIPQEQYITIVNTLLNEYGANPDLRAHPKKYISWDDLIGVPETVIMGCFFSLLTPVSVHCSVGTHPCV